MMFSLSRKQLEIVANSIHTALVRPTAGWVVYSSTPLVSALALARYPAHFCRVIVLLSDAKESGSPGKHSRLNYNQWHGADNTQSDAANPEHYIEYK